MLRNINQQRKGPLFSELQYMKILQEESSQTLLGFICSTEAAKHRLEVIILLGISGNSWVQMVILLPVSGGLHYHVQSCVSQYTAGKPPSTVLQPKNLFRDMLTVRYIFISRHIVSSQVLIVWIPLLPRHGLDQYWIWNHPYSVKGMSELNVKFCF